MKDVDDADESAVDVKSILPDCDAGGVDPWTRANLPLQIIKRVVRLQLPTEWSIHREEEDHENIVDPKQNLDNSTCWASCACLADTGSIFFCPFSAFSEPLYPYLSLGSVINFWSISFFETLKSDQRFQS